MVVRSPAPDLHHLTNQTPNTNITTLNRDVSLENVMLSRGKYGGPPLCRLIDLEMARPGVEGEEQEQHADAWGREVRFVFSSCM